MSDEMCNKGLKDEQFFNSIVDRAKKKLVVQMISIYLNCESFLDEIKWMVVKTNGHMKAIDS